MNAVGSILWPYDEVEVGFSDDKQTFWVRAPWIRADFPVTKAMGPTLSQLVSKFSDQSLAGTDVRLVNIVFQSLRDFPFCYTLPMAKPDATDRPALFDNNLIDLTPQELLNWVLQNQAKADSVLSLTARAAWQWDHDSAFGFASYGDGIHPESLFSVVRRYHLIDVMNDDGGQKVFTSINALDDDERKSVTAILVRQNHYITQKCQESLQPALKISGHARGLLQDFMKEEQGHDLILAAAIKELTIDPEAVPVTTVSQALMAMLRFVAGRNFLAFAMVIDLFERSTYSSRDPLANLLDQGGFAKAGNLVNRHKDINDAGGHENIASAFLGQMAVVDSNYALEALRLVELTSMINNSVTRAVWALSKSGQS